MRLALSTDSFFPREGGAERQLRRVCSQLVSNHSWEVIVVARRFDGLSARDNVDGLQIVRVGPAVPPRLGAAVTAALVARQLRAIRPDVILAIQAGWSALAAGAAAAALPRRKPPMVLRLTGGSAAGSELATRAGSRCYSLITSLILRSADAIVSPAKHLLDEPGAFRQILRDKGCVIRNGVVVAKQLRTPTSPCFIVWIGRPDPVKGLGDFVELAHRMPTLQFLAVGPDASAVVDSPNLRCTGWDPDPTTRLATAALFVSTSRYEGSPNAALEALAAGVPVVAYDIDAYRELAAIFVRGVWLVPAFDMDALRSVVEHVVALQRANQTAARFHADVPAIGDVALEWNDLFVGLLAGRRSTYRGATGPRHATSSPPGAPGAQTKRTP